MKNAKFLFLTKILSITMFLILAGCTTTSPASTPSGEVVSDVGTIAVSHVSSTPTPPSIVALPSATLGKTPTATSTATVQLAIPTSTLTPQPTATETPFAIPTPPGGGIDEQVLWLLETNNGCQLPCWWGIIPGQTEWPVAEEFLSRFDQDIYESSSTPRQVYYGVSIPLPSEVFTEDQTELGILVRNGLVEIIETDVSIGDTPPGYLSPYLLSTFLTTYGEPSEVWLFTYPSPFEEGDLPFIVVLFYADQGIAALYSDNGVLQGDMVHGCPQEDPVSVLSLWYPLLGLTFEQVVSGSSAFNRDFLPLEETTEMNVATFYETFKNPDHTACLETRADLWY